MSTMSPKKYYPKRSTDYIKKAEVDNDPFYQQSLGIINDSHRSVRRAHAAKQAFFSRKDTTHILKDIAISIGYTPVRPPNYSETNSRFSIKDRHGAPMKVDFIPCKSNKVLIALPGSASSPRALTGHLRDYNNSYAVFWANRCWNVYTLALTKGDLSYPRLGLSGIGVDISRTLDLAKFARKRHGPNAHIAIGGISRGARLAELAAVLSDDINGAISVGGAARYDSMSSEFSLSGTSKYPDSFPARISMDVEIFELLVRLGKLIYASIGVADAGSWGESGQSKFQALRKASDRLAGSGLFSYSIFAGAHEANPQQEVIGYESLLSAQTK